MSYIRDQSVACAACDGMTTRVCSDCGCCRECCECGCDEPRDDTNWNNLPYAPDCREGD